MQQEGQQDKDKKRGRGKGTRQGHRTGARQGKGQERKHKHGSCTLFRCNQSLQVAMPKVGKVKVQVGSLHCKPSLRH